MKYSSKLTLEIKMREFYAMAIPRTNCKKTLHKIIKDELYHCWNGIVSGENGGSAIDWKELFYYQLWKDGWIKQTDQCKSIYGEFK